MKTIILIPSRMASTRLPGKPLAIIGGKTMIQRVWEQAVDSNIGDVVVACSEPKIYDLIINLGGNLIASTMVVPNLNARDFLILLNSL